jgi:hypothetical protein
MKLFTVFHKAFVLAGLFALMFSGFVFAQSEDDPNLDQIPRSLLNAVPNQTDAPLSSVITIGNWDNFNLGVDFAENNMAAHPSIPTWYFTAYNTNATHHTEDGSSWAIDNPSFGANMWGDPVVAYDSLGNLYYENMYGSSTIQGCKVVKSTDNGNTWGPSVTAISGVDKNWLAADQTSGPYANYVYATMTANSGGNFSRSTDQGSTWQTTFTPGTQSLPGMMVCVGPNGNIQGGCVYVVTNSGSSFASTYTFYKSTDGGATFSNLGGQSFAGYVGTDVGGRNSVENMRTRPYPFITADNSYGPNRGKLYLVYASNDPPGNGNKPDIWLRVSTDGGDTWSTAKKVNDDAGTTSNHQWHPATWCDKETGRLYIQWMDTRDTPTHDSALIYATYTDDAGATFAVNQQISNKKMKINCSSCGGGGTPRYQGDYNGIISNKKVAMAGWTDFRNNNFLSATAYFPDFAMAIDKSTDTLYTPMDQTTISVSIPEVKLYTDTVLLSASINPVPTSGTVTFNFPSGSTITSYPNSLPVEVNLSGTVPVGTYMLIFNAASPNGTPVHKRTCSLKVLVGNVFMVNTTATPDTVCQGVSSQLSSLVNGGTLPYTYAWTPVTGLNDPTLANPIATPDITTTYHLTVTDAGMNTTTDSVKVTVRTAPASPGPISGPEVTCMDSTATYYVELVPGATSYSWTAPSGATIVSGQNTSSVSIQWGNAGGTVSVIAGNACGNSTPSVMDVTVTVVPDAPGTIQGNEIGCKNSLVEVSIDTVPGATSYLWTVPADATIVGGQGTSAISISWGSLSGNVTVVAENACGQSPVSEKFLETDSIPLDAGTISGNDTVCTNHAGYAYAIDPIANASSYVWSLPSGATIATGQGTASVTIDFGQDAVSGNIGVYGVNDCGLGVPSAFAVFVSECAGIGEHSLLSSVALFPNPVEGKLNIRISGKEEQVDLEVRDVTGQLVISDKFTGLQADNTRQVDVTGLRNGIYFIRLMNGNRTFTGKFVVQQ